MRKTYQIATAFGLAIGVAWWSGAGWAQQQGAGEKAGEKLDELGQKVKRGFSRAEDAVRDSFQKTRESVKSMGVAARVYGRLHWDKALQSSDLNVKVADGVATLSGSVPTATAKAKAVTLASETVGVTRVVDELTVPSSTSDGSTSARP